MYQKLKKTLLRVIRLFRAIPSKRTARRILIISVLGLLLLTAVYAITFFWPRTVAFSFSNKTCFANPTILPGLVGHKQNATYKALPAHAFTVAGYPVYAHETCITALQAPRQGQTEQLTLTPRTTLSFQKRITVRTGDRPQLTSQKMLDRPVATKDPLALSFNISDVIFTYQLRVEDKLAPCTTQDKVLLCDVQKLALAQSTAYTFSLERLFKGAVTETIFRRALTTVEAVHITGASITAGQMVYDKPNTITLQLNKSVEQIKNAKLFIVQGEQRQELPLTASVADDKVIVQVNDPLPRNASLLLAIDDIVAPDGGFLSAPYTLPFQTSGGPKVVRINIGKSKVQPAGAITLTFDSDISSAQAVASFIRIESGGQAVAATVTLNGSTITVRPAALPRCATFSIKVLDGLQNSFGVSGGSAWQYNSRVLCQTVFSIGTSVLGRSITAYSFGGGSNKIIFLGGTHGNEKSSVYVLNRWIEYLENNPDRIPAHRTIVVIPNLNPDGYATGQRTNAHNVDLNRNFPTGNWKQGVTMPDKSFNANGGGAYPLSEPESKAIANYVLAQSPRLVLTYHASGGVVVPNGSDDSNALAITYAQKSSVGYLSNSGTASFFEYDTTGAFEDWLHEKHGKPALLIELLTKTNNEYSGHQNALWFIAQLP